MQPQQQIQTPTQYQEQVEIESNSSNSDGQTQRFQQKIHPHIQQSELSHETAQQNQDNKPHSQSESYPSLSFTNKDDLLEEEEITQMTNPPPQKKFSSNEWSDGEEDKFTEVKDHEDFDNETLNTEAQSQLNEKDQSRMNSQNFEKQFEEVRFNSMECNLIDMDVEDQTQKKQQEPSSKPKERSSSSLPNNFFGKQYVEFLENRTVHIEPPQLINMGYITSYKLYQIKTKKADSSKGFDTCVNRRFSDFQYLNELFIEKYGGYIIPMLPEKNFWAIVNLEGKQYKDIRTKSLIKYLNRVLRHKKLRLTDELRDFLFENDTHFSISKGQYTQKTKNIENTIKNISSEALEYGKFFYKKIVSLSTGKKQSDSRSMGNSQYAISSSSSKSTKQDLALGEFQIIIGDLMRVTKDLKSIVQNSIEQIKRIEELYGLFMMTSQNVQKSSSNSKVNISKSVAVNSESISIQIQNDSLFEEYEDMCEFIQSCAMAINRRNHIRSEIESLKMQETSLSEKHRNAPRSSELDVVRSKLDKYKKLNEIYTVELLKELEVHADEGKGMLTRFVDKFEKMKRDFYAAEAREEEQ